jgi:hypothetical protein
MAQLGAQKKKAYLSPLGAAFPNLSLSKVSRDPVL